MRVSNRFLYYQLVKDLGQNTEKLFRLNGQISSGKRIDKPSEDPLGLSKVLVNRTELSAFDQFKKTITLAEGWLARTDTITNDVDNLLTRASELAVQMSSSTATQSAREGAAEEIKGIREQILGLANSKYGNKYLFGGTMTQTRPFLDVDVASWQDDVDTMAADAAGAVANLGGAAAAGDRYINTTDGSIYQYDGAAWQVSTAAAEGISTVVADAGSELYVYNGGQWSTQYQGNDTTFSMQIGKSDTVEINVPGSELFKNPSGNVLMSLMNLEKALRSNDIQGVRDQLPEIENASKTLMNKLAKVGAVVNRLEHTTSVLQQATVDNKATTSDIEDLDYADAITQLQNQQTIYQATLKSASMITSMSLVDYV
jgi:flagellar hook-associated protein 3 FlgL